MKQVETIKKVGYKYRNINNPSIICAILSSAGNFYSTFHN